MLLVAFAAVVSTVGCGDSTKPAVENRPPVIRDVVITPSSVVLGDVSRVVALASDPDGDEVTYVWTMQGGSLTDTTLGTTTWTAPDTAGSFWLWVSVSDEEFTVRDSARVFAGEGQLTVTSDPPGAIITVDGDVRSETTPHTFEKLSIGPHRVAISSTDFLYTEDFQDVDIAHGGDKALHFEHREAVFEALNLGRTDFTSIGSVAFLASGTGVLYLAATASEGAGLYSSAVSPVTGEANGIMLTGDVSLKEAVAVTADGAWVIWTSISGALQAAPLINPDGNGVVDNLGSRVELKSGSGYGAALAEDGRLAWSATHSNQPAAAPLFWGFFEGDPAPDEDYLSGSILATATFGRRPSWDPLGVLMVYELDGKLLLTPPQETGVVSPDTLKTRPGYNQRPAWGRWGPRHIAYINGPDEVNATTVYIQSSSSEHSVAVFNGLFDPRGLAWNRILPMIAASHNLPNNPQIVLISNLPIP